MEQTVRGLNSLTGPSIQCIQSVRVLDATRVSDGLQVLLKAIPDNEEGETERAILEYLSSPNLRSDPRNHAVALLDTVKLPYDGDMVLVMPLLRSFGDPRFQTVGEAVEFFRQVFEVRPFYSLPDAS